MIDAAPQPLQHEQEAGEADEPLDLEASNLPILQEEAPIETPMTIDPTLRPISTSVEVRVEPTEEPIVMYMCSTGSDIPQTVPDCGIECVALQDNVSLNVALQDNVLTHPLVSTGVVSQEMADIFQVPDDEIPVGRKRPLRIQSKARVMSSDEVYAEIRQKSEELKEKERKKEERRQNIEENKRKKATAQSKRAQPRAGPSTTRRRNNEDNVCFICQIEYEDDRVAVQKKWVGCDGRNCPHWVCPRCLPSGFCYSDDYFCDDCDN